MKSEILEKKFGDAQHQPKESYVTPRLTVYGTVADLTKGQLKLIGGTDALGGQTVIL